MRLIKTDTGRGVAGGAVTYSCWVAHSLRYSHSPVTVSAYFNWIFLIETRARHVSKRLRERDVKQKRKQRVVSLIVNSNKTDENGTMVPRMPIVKNKWKAVNSQSEKQKMCFYNYGHSWSLFLLFCIWIQCLVNSICQWMDSNGRSLVSEATALPTVIEHRSNFKLLNRDSNPGPQYGMCRWIHWATYPTIEIV